MEDNLKKCPACAEEIKIKAIKCKHCGEYLEGHRKITGKKARKTTGLIALFLGGLGFHHFYLGNTFLGIIYLVFCWTFIPMIISFFEALSIFSMNDEDFYKKYILKEKIPKKKYQSFSLSKGESKKKLK